MTLKLYVYPTMINYIMFNNEVSITHYDGRMPPDIASSSKLPNEKRFRKLGYSIITTDGLR